MDPSEQESPFNTLMDSLLQNLAVLKGKLDANGRTTSDLLDKAAALKESNPSNTATKDRGIDDLVNLSTQLNVVSEDIEPPQVPVAESVESKYKGQIESMETIISTMDEDNRELRRAVEDYQATLDKILVVHRNLQESEKRYKLKVDTLADTISKGMQHNEMLLRENKAIKTRMADMMSIMRNLAESEEDQFQLEESYLNQLVTENETLRHMLSISSTATG